MAPLDSSQGLSRTVPCSGASLIHREWSGLHVQRDEGEGEEGRHDQGYGCTAAALSFQVPCTGATTGEKRRASPAGAAAGLSAWASGAAGPRDANPLSACTDTAGLQESAWREDVGTLDYCCRSLSSLRYQEEHVP